MAIRDHIDDDFNASTRQVDCKVEIYFDEVPLTVTKSDYLISCDELEEVTAESSDPIGAVSANEFSMVLLNTNGIFNPHNTSGPYYSKIKTGIVIKPYFRLLTDTDTLNWIQMGTFYVSEWSAEVTGTKATVYATDIMKDVFGKDPVDIQVVADNTFKQFIDYVFGIIGYTPAVSADLTQLLPFGYVKGVPKTFLTELMAGALAMCHSDRLGGIVVNPIAATRVNRATLTDANQVISVSAKQSTLKTYNGVSLTYSLPQLLYDQKVMEAKDFKVKVGTHAYDTMSFNEGPVAGVGHIAAQTVDNKVQVTTFSYSPWQIKMTINNDTEAQLLTALSVYGTRVDFTDTVIADSTTPLLTINNKYIQTPEYAANYKTFLNAFVSNITPVLEVTIRGNLLLKLGDLITIQSTKYHLNFTGLIWRIKTSYPGYLKQTITLLNSEIVGVIP